jgi:hypothetical protein
MSNQGEPLVYEDAEWAKFRAASRWQRVVTKMKLIDYHQSSSALLANLGITASPAARLRDLGNMVRHLSAQETQNLGQQLSRIIFKKTETEPEEQGEEPTPTSTSGPPVKQGPPSLPSQSSAGSQGSRPAQWGARPKAPPPDFYDHPDTPYTGRHPPKAPPPGFSQPEVTPIYDSRPRADEFLTAPICSCHLTCRRLICRKEGPNFGREFWRCPRPQTQQCEFFMWLQHQPSWRLLQSEDQAHEYRMMAQNPCSHQNISRAGSNFYLEKQTCRDCGKVLRHMKKQEARRP